MTRGPSPLDEFPVHQASLPIAQPATSDRNFHDRCYLDAQRFAQVGTWEGSFVVDGQPLDVSPHTWVGTRDRSRGIRRHDPSGFAEFLSVAP